MLLERVTKLVFVLGQCCIQVLSRLLFYKKNGAKWGVWVAHMPRPPASSHVSKPGLHTKCDNKFNKNPCKNNQRKPY